MFGKILVPELLHDYFEFLKFYVIFFCDVTPSDLAQSYQHLGQPTISVIKVVLFHSEDESNAKSYGATYRLWDLIFFVPSMRIQNLTLYCFIGCNRPKTSRPICLFHSIRVTLRIQVNWAWVIHLWSKIQNWPPQKSVFLFSSLCPHVSFMISSPFPLQPSPAYCRSCFYWTREIKQSGVLSLPPLINSRYSGVLRQYAFSFLWLIIITPPHLKGP